jgi:glycosyltransferase involved in cell wall biosynthesis
MNKNNPLITIIIPTYNRLNLLQIAIESALNQTYTNIEIIVSDNFSNDGTKEFFEKKPYVSSPNFKYIRKESNVGATKNFLSALNFSNGEYVAFLADDDCIEPEYIEKLYEAMSDSAVVHAVSFANEIMPNGAIKRQVNYNFIKPLSDKKIIENLYDFRRNSEMALMFYGLTRKNILMEIFPEPEYNVTRGKKSVSGLELPYFARMLVKGRIQIVPSILYNYMGEGCRDGQQSLAMTDTKNMNKIDFIIINISRFFRMLIILKGISTDRYSKLKTISIFILSFINNILLKIIMKIIIYMRSALVVGK